MGRYLKATIGGKKVWQLREISAQSGYAGQNSLIAHFGVGDASIVDSMVILWPAGGEQVLENIEVNQKLIIAEESGLNKVQDYQLAKRLNFRIYPNPSKPDLDQIQVVFENAAQLEEGILSLHDTIGQLVWKKEVKVLPGNSTFSISMAEHNLVPGIYQMRLQIGLGQLNRKIIFH